MMILPNEINTPEDIRIVATLMKERDIQVPIYGYTCRNGKQTSVKACVARADESGSDILFEYRHIKDSIMLPSMSIYPQIIEYLKMHIHATCIA